MQRLEVNGAVRPIYGSLGVKRLITWSAQFTFSFNCTILNITDSSNFPKLPVQRPREAIKINSQTPLTSVRTSVTLQFVLYLLQCAGGVSAYVRASLFNPLNTELKPICQ